MSSTILLSLLQKLLRIGAMTAATWLVSKGWLKAPAAESVTNFLGDYYAPVSVFAGAVLWDVWAHINKSAWIVRIKTIMGQINPSASPDKSSLSDASAVVGKVLPLCLLAGFAMTVSGCFITLPGAVKVATAAAPSPGSVVFNTVESRVASYIRGEILAHPAIKQYINPLAKGARSLSVFKLPAPNTLLDVFQVWTSFAPSGSAYIDNVIEGLLDRYKADYSTANAVDSAEVPYLELFARGIEDGEAQAQAASTTEAP